MEKKEKKRIAAVFLGILAIALISDLTGGRLKDGAFLERGKTGEEAEEIILEYYTNDSKDGQEYMLHLLPVGVTSEEAEEYFARVIECVETEFCGITTEIPIKESYPSLPVEVEWAFRPVGMVGENGTIRWEKTKESVLTITAEAVMTCGNYEKMYQFCFDCIRPVPKEEEVLEAAIEECVLEHMEEEGSGILRLPTEINGVAVTWKEKRDYLSWKILLLEGVGVAALWYGRRIQKKKEADKIRMEIEADYPDLVSELALLMGAGMTTRQAWNRISALYSEKWQKEEEKQKGVFPYVFQLNRRLQEGESEKMAYAIFEKEVSIPCYHRLMAMLLTNLEKGSSRICELLEQESSKAYEERILKARKLGEEASTRMLLPLMLMMFIVMAIVMLPALIEFAA